MASIDLATLDAAAFSVWIFNRPVEAEDASWFTDHTFKSENPVLLLQLFTTIFRDFKAVAARYSRAQVDKGIWAILSSAGIDAAQFMTNLRIPRDVRISFIESMFTAFADVASHLQPPYVETAYYMWFDLVCGAFWRQAAPAPLAFKAPQTDQEVADFLRSAVSLANLDIDAEWINLTKDDREAKSRRADAFRAAEAARLLAHPLNADQRAIQDAILEILVRILHINHLPCQSSALHGLGHLHHPRVATIVGDYISQHGHEWPAESKPYLESCRDGTVL